MMTHLTIRKNIKNMFRFGLNLIKIAAQTKKPPIYTFLIKSYELKKTQPPSLWP